MGGSYKIHFVLGMTAKGRESRGNKALIHALR